MLPYEGAPYPLRFGLPPMRAFWMGRLLLPPPPLPPPSHHAPASPPPPLPPDPSQRTPRPSCCISCVWSSTPPCSGP